MCFIWIIFVLILDYYLESAAASMFYVELLKVWIFSNNLTPKERKTLVAMHVPRLK